MKLTVREVKIDKESYVDGNERKNQLENDLRRQRVLFFILSTN